MPYMFTNQSGEMVVTLEQQFSSVLGVISTNESFNGYYYPAIFASAERRCAWFEYKIRTTLREPWPDYGYYRQVSRGT